MWKDWDSTSIENVNQLTKWYGQEVNGSVMIGYDNSITPLTDKEGAYYKMLKFFFQANQMGLIDPDSATQDWNSACDKMKTKRTYLVWNNWMQGFTNSPTIGEAGANYMGIPIADMQVFQTSDTYYGSGRCFAIGAQVSEENKLRILEFLDWLASPEGLMSEMKERSIPLMMTEPLLLRKTATTDLLLKSWFLKKKAVETGRMEIIRLTSGSFPVLRSIRTPAKPTPVICGLLIWKRTIPRPHRSIRSTLIAKTRWIIWRRMA